MVRSVEDLETSSIISESSSSSMDTADESETMYERWHKIVKAIDETTQAAFPDGPAFDEASPSTFQSYWHEVFSRLRETVLSDPDIPQYLTSPPTRRFTITLFDHLHVMGCPCCHPEGEPNIVLENENGVTKEDFMNGFIDYMYRDKIPSVWVEPSPLIQDDSEENDDSSTSSDAASNADSDDDDMDEVEAEEDEGVLVYYSSWMSTGGKDDKRKVYGNEPNIFLYCCWQHEYLEFKGKMEEKYGKIDKEETKEEAKEEAKEAEETPVEEKAKL